MGQTRLRRKLKLAEELVREFYESMLMLTLGIMLQWNQWHVMSMLNGKKLPEGVTEPQPVTWSSIYFTSGLLLTLIQYRPEWRRRVKPKFRTMFLWVEIFFVLFFVDFILLSMWQPLLCIIDQVLHTLGHSKWSWARVLFRYCPIISTWLTNDAFYFVRFMCSFTWFLLAIEMSAPKWRLAIDFLVLGQLPDVVPRHRRKRHHSRSHNRSKTRNHSHC